MDYSLSQSLFDVFMYIIMLNGIYSVFVGKYNKPNAGNGQFWAYGICAFLISLFGGLDWDYYSYEPLLDAYYYHGWTHHMEPPYFWIVDLAGNYYLWRTIVWGVATATMMISIKRFKCNYISTYVFITLFYILSFYKLRGSLGISLFFLGYSLIYTNHSRVSLKDLIIGIALVISSFFFHKSMFVPLAILVVIWFIPLNKKTLLISLILYPFALSFVTAFLGSGELLMLTSDIEEIQTAISSASSYASEEAAETTIFGKIANFLHYAPIYLSLGMVMCNVIINKKVYFNSQLCHLLWFWYIITYIASLFFLQEVSFWIYIRLLTIGYFPMALILGYYYRHKHTTLLMKLIIILALCSSLLTVYYQFISHFPNFFK